MTDFSQDFLAVGWIELGWKNFVFSPLSMHSVLAMLISGASNNSTTQSELLFGFGGAVNIRNIEKFYGQLVESYKGPEVEKNLKFGTRVWTSPRYFPKIDECYKRKIENLYDAEFDKFTPRGSEKNVNDWVNEVTQGKIDNILSKFSYLGAVHKLCRLKIGDF